jgi:hypothetical protein
MWNCSSASEEESCKYEDEETGTFCGFCHVEYRDPVAANLGAKGKQRNCTTRGEMM